MTQMVSILLICIALAIAGFIICPVTAENSETLTTNELLLMEELGHFTLSSDDQNIIYFKTLGTDLTPPANNGTLMRIDIAKKTDTAISIPGESVTAYSLSPDGKTVAYTALPIKGGDAYLKIIGLSNKSEKKIEKIPPELIDSFTWLNNDTILYSAADNTNTPTGSDNVIVVDETPQPVVLYALSPDTGKKVRVTNNNNVITKYAPSPDGMYIIYKAASSPAQWQSGAQFHYMLHDVASGTDKELLNLTEGYQDNNEFAWSQDSSVVYIEKMNNGGINYPIRYTTDVIAYYPGSGIMETMPLDWPRGMHVDIFNDDVEMNPFVGGVYILLADGTNPKLTKYTKTETGWKKENLTGGNQGNIFALESSRDGGTLYYNYNSASVYPQIYSARVTNGTINSEEKLTKLNPSFSNKSLGTSEVVNWTGANGDNIEGVVRYPPGYTKGTLYPLELVIHGGPTYTDFDSWRDTWEFPYHLITAQGAVELSVNYHGSTNFGFDFGKSIENKHYYNLPIEDFQAGIKYLAEKGIINQSQVGITGWSNGGILSLAFITRDQSLKAAIAGAGTADDFAQYSNNNGAVMNAMYYTDPPYLDPISYTKTSPVFSADKVTTPLLMMIGSNDNAVNPASAWVTYRTFKLESKGPVRFIIFVGEPHHPHKLINQQRKISEELGWLQKYLFTQ